jgi:hypothetical protein
MEFLFGEGQYGLRFLFAFIVVLGLIGLTAWLVRRFGAGPLGTAATRGRQPRLAVVDAAQVDGRRRLILIRRDNVEHLLMIGGPSDVVIEPNIVRAVAAAREGAAPRAPAAPEPMPRGMPLNEGAWPLQPEPMPAPAPPPPPRPQRAPQAIAPQPPMVEETMQWHAEPEPPPPAPPPRQARMLDPLAGLAAELSRNPPAPAPSDPAIPPRPVRERPAREREMGREREMARERESAREAAREQEPPLAPPPPQPPRERVAARAPQPAAPAETPFASPADQNLAEMAQRLEAALRRPGAKVEARTDPRADPRADTRPDPRPVAPPPPPPQPQAAPPEPPEVDIVEEEPPPPPDEAKPVQGEARPARDAKPAGGRSLYDSLEQEMASLLGRPNGKS